MNAPPSADLPVAFAQRLRAILPEERFDRCWQTFFGETATVFWANGLKTSVGELTAELRGQGFSLEPLPWKTDAFLVPAGQRRALTECAACRQGRLYIQNPSSMVPPLLLDPWPGERVLDLAAAPGGKTVQLAQRVGKQGQVSAVEVARARFFRLRAVLERCGADNARPYLKDGTRLWQQCPEHFDRVLLDAPCTGEGLFKASAPETFAYWSKKKIAEMSRKQKRLLFSAVQCLRPGGALVYATCTFAPEENEAVIERALELFGGALFVEEVVLPFANVQPGLQEWQGKAFHPELRKAVRILPDGVMEGFFACRLRKLKSTSET
jgi:16S rRNA (cytosine1407-C5)-methyltransferase